MLYLLCLRKAEQIVLGHPVSGKPTAETPQFVFMDEVLGQSHFTNRPVLFASIPEDTPGPSSRVCDQEEEEPVTSAPATHTVCVCVCVCVCPYMFSFLFIFHYIIYVKLTPNT